MCLFKCAINKIPHRIQLFLGTYDHLFKFFEIFKLPTGTLIFEMKQSSNSSCSRFIHYLILTLMSLLAIQAQKYNKKYPARSTQMIHIKNPKIANISIPH